MSTSQAPNTPRPGDHKAFSDHIGELRMRVIWVVLTFIVVSAIAYNYRDLLVHIVLAPLGQQKLVYLTPAGGFAFIFQITMYAGVLVSAPLLVYHLYKFVQPALPVRAMRYSLRIVLASTVLLLGGVFFGYFVAVPAALHFLTAFAGTYVEANLTADSYLNFIIAYVAGLGLLFQLPLLLVFWNWISPLSPKKLLSSQRLIILFAFIAAAMITPTPDPTNQAMIAVPIILIYQIGVVAVLLINRSSKKTRTKAAPFHETAIMPDVDETALFPEPPSLSMPVEAEQTVASAPAAPAPAPVISAKPKAVRKIPVGIDGIRRPPATRQTRVRAPMQRAEARLITPARPAPVRPIRAVNTDGIIRVVSS